MDCLQGGGGGDGVTAPTGGNQQMELVSSCGQLLCAIRGSASLELL